MRVDSASCRTRSANQSVAIRTTSRSNTSSARWLRKSQIFSIPPFAVSLSILLLTGAVLSGLGSLSGILFGALFIEFVPTWAESIDNRAPTVIYGVILLGVLLVLPGGASQLLQRIGVLMNRANVSLRRRRAAL